MQHIDVSEASQHLGDLIEAALKGEKVIITKDRQAVLLVPAVSEGKRIEPGSAAGLILYMADDFDAPLDEFKDYME